MDFDVKIIRHRDILLTKANSSFPFVTLSITNKIILLCYILHQEWRKYWHYIRTYYVDRVDHNFFAYIQHVWVLNQNFQASLVNCIWLLFYSVIPLCRYPHALSLNVFPWTYRRTLRSSDSRWTSVPLHAPWSRCPRRALNARLATTSLRTSVARLTRVTDLDKKKKKKSFRPEKCYSTAVLLILQEDIEIPDYEICLNSPLL